MTKKKLFVAIIAALCSCFYSSQVGINTTNPQQALEVSGSGTGNQQPIIRIEGLNRTNNSAHESTASVKRVFADQNGTLVIADNNQTNKFYNIALPNTTVPAGTERSVASQTFTLDYPSLVHVEARVGMQVTNDLSDPTAPASVALRDGKARLFGSYYKITSAPAGVVTNTSFGQVVISMNTNTGGAQLNGQYYIEPRKDLYLPKGTYTLVLYGYSQDGSMGFAVNAISQASQQMMISITPVSY